jgi:hypothetical protein
VFYDAKDIVRKPDGRMGVDERHTGIQFNPVADAQTPDKIFIGPVAQTVAAHHVPPIGGDLRTHQDQAVEITMDEEIANNDYIQPIARLLIEIDCPGRLDRILSAFLTGDRRPCSG